MLFVAPGEGWGPVRGTVLNTFDAKLLINQSDNAKGSKSTMLDTSYSRSSFLKKKKKKKKK